MDQSALWAQLERVLDPELDESIVRLGFVQRLEQDGSAVRVVLRLPTYWCSPNFAYLMADGVRRVLTELPGIEAVRVELEEHFASEEISSGVTSGRSFRELFPTEAQEELDELRYRFLVKGMRAGSWFSSKHCAPLARAMTNSSSPHSGSSSTREIWPGLSLTIGVVVQCAVGLSNGTLSGVRSWGCRCCPSHHYSCSPMDSRSLASD